MDYKTYSYDPMFFINVSKIWSAFLNGSRNTFQIDTLYKLECLGAVFSIDISSKLRKVSDGSRNFVMTKNTKQKLYIIHLTLVLVYKIINQTGIFFERVFKELHRSLKQYFERTLIDDQTIENQFILLQIYLKSHLSLNIQIGPREEEVVYRLIERLATYPPISKIL
ncbi:hypothetical protein RF11_00331 [Thelohanellus kitauei]|uniref:Uncharacterized protein n=1 Tax=Thelohanellus kitauei TaxID=669202 RepID=A0A0C2NLC5_THEKT|nr:hypothetical protein RF11_00331 [Thelohanellus kitauei]